MNLILQLVSWILLIASTSINGQKNIIDPGNNYVIASGLRLRENPNQKSKILTVIPFGSRVEYLSNESYGKDTIDVELKDYTSKIIGTWVQVKFNKFEGYVLNSYLSYSVKPDPIYGQMNTNFLYLHPGCDCNYNIYNVTKWNFYGFYKINNDTLQIKKIKVTYTADHEIDYTCPIILSASENKNLEFIIGVKAEMFKDKSTIYYKTVEILNSKNETQQTKELKRFGLTLLFQPNKNRDDFFELIYSKENKKQKLNLAEFNFPTRIKFIGDLDNDGKYDFIISYGETAGPTILYLSSQAKGNQFLKMVASFFSSYCC
jgi:hypothetical protein